MKRIKLVVVLIVLVSLFCGCDSKSYQEKLNNSPERQPDTYWVNEEDSFAFYTNSNYKQYGVICNNSDIIYVHIYMVGRGGFLNVYYDEEDSNSIEEWDYTIISKNEFVAKVNKTTYFNVDDQFTFHKVSKQEYETILESIGAVDNYIT